MKEYEFKMRGVDHAFVGGSYEDAIKYSINGSKVLVTMADGMGSARLASVGSTESTKSAERTLRRSALDVREGMVASIVSTASVSVAMSIAQKAVLELAKSRGDDVSDYDTTLMVVSFDDETGVLDYGYVGDGGIIVVYEDRTIELLEQPQKGSDGSSTFALTNPSMWRFGRRDSVSSFMIATDGVLDALVEAEDEYVTVDETKVGMLLSPGSCKAELDRYFGATLEDSGNSPIAGVVDDRSVFICWSSTAEGKGRRRL